ncbi:hypothetical protein XENTR_v10019697 [Xenopus tropicalis]|uniref:TYRO protein tyrosine kinase-binding protein n=1 Tax=Xenopus tropicalis TaxID=8364 RepID=A0A803JE74_XENTR|nr:T-cell surface glycoprotein CD3 delta chain isoform X2 [Xenopus tropicalis]KAE8594567.1 hypothetical protein XENTR_v10019697 [Xenopus tropicalis]
MLRTAMRSPMYPLSLLILWLLTARAASSESEACQDCYRIDTATLVGVVLGDILLTVIIILVVYFCTKQTFQKRAAVDEQKIYINMPMKKTKLHTSAS